MGEQLNENWPGPKGMIPVTSGKADDANIRVRNYLDNILVEMRIIDATTPSLETEIFGEKFASPIMTPAFSHLNKAVGDGQTPMEEYALAAKNMNLLNWVGMEPDEDYIKIAEVGAKTVRIIKPFMDHSLILHQIDIAQATGAFAVGVDIDHVVGSDGLYDVVDGYQLGPVMFEDLKQYASHANVPFIAKGVLSVQDAVKAADAGCKGIVVSHHHGRIPFGMPPVALLPQIKKALEGRDVTIFCDCHIDDGYDAYKALALGADAVSVGRGILRPLLSDGAKGVEDKITRMNQQLMELMTYTGVKDTTSFDASVLHM